MKAGRRPIDDADFVARVLVDATIHDNDRKAAERHQITVRTVQRYRVRALRDEALSALVAKKLEVAERRWDRVRNRGLTVLVERMIELAQTELDIDKVTRAVKELGELDIAGTALNVGPGHHQPGQAPAEDPGGSPGAPEGEEP